MPVGADDPIIGENPSPPPENPTKGRSLRMNCINFALMSRPAANAVAANDIVAVAKTFENYIKGSNDPNDPTPPGEVDEIAGIDG